MCQISVTIVAKIFRHDSGLIKIMFTNYRYSLNVFAAENARNVSVQENVRLELSYTLNFLSLFYYHIS